MAITSATLEQSSKQLPFAARRKMLRREGTFSIYDSGIEIAEKSPVKIVISILFFFISDSGVESSTTFVGHDCATSDGEYLPNEDTISISTPQPTLEDAMQRLAETIKEFDSHAEQPCAETAETSLTDAPGKEVA